MHRSYKVTQFECLLAFLRTLQLTYLLREAINVSHFLSSIKDSTAWQISLLSKEEEARAGAFGVAAGMGPGRAGYVLDVGGGSCQLNYVTWHNGRITSSDDAVSLPFGAAALSRLLGTETLEQVESKLRAGIQMAWTSIKNSTNKTQPTDLYCCGGGGRGFGYLLMHQRAKSNASGYPFPMVDGFSGSKNEIGDLMNVIATMSSSESAQTFRNVFRISSRRARQAPAVALLLKHVIAVNGEIESVIFSKGGTKEGTAMQLLPFDVLSNSPIEQFFASVATEMKPEIEQLLQGALSQKWKTLDWMERVLPVACASVYSGMLLSKDLAAESGLKSTSTGWLANLPCVTHRERAIIGLIECEKLGGELANFEYRQQLYKFLDPEDSAATIYVGRLLRIYLKFHPVSSKARLRLKFCLDQSESHCLVQEIGDSSWFSDGLASLIKACNLDDEPVKFI